MAASGVRSERGVRERGESCKGESWERSPERCGPPWRAAHLELASSLGLAEAFAASSTFSGDSCSGVKARRRCSAACRYPQGSPQMLTTAQHARSGARRRSRREKVESGSPATCAVPRARRRRLCRKQHVSASQRPRKYSARGEWSSDSTPAASVCVARPTRCDLPLPASLRRPADSQRQ